MGGEEIASQDVSVWRPAGWSRLSGGVLDLASHIIDRGARSALAFGLGPE
jgi:hypothetical protein